MRFLADESCDFRVVKELREAGYDVAAVAESAHGATDDEVLELARIEKRILVTEDRDFGQLVFASESTGSGGVLYVRCPESARAILPGAISDLVLRLGSRLERSFVVWTPTRIRIRSLHAG